MFRRSPFKDAEVNPESPQLDFQDRVGLTIGFLWFYHRIIIAVVLLAGLGFWIYRSVNTESNASNIPNLQKPKLDEIPSASLEFAPEKGNTEVPDARPIVDSGIDKPSPPPKEPASELDRLIETGSVNELIEESLNIRERIGKNTAIVDFMLCSRRAKVSRRLMEMETTPTQREFAMISYIESISMLDSLNVQGRLNIDGPRAALKEVGAKYADHSNANVKTKANLAIMLAPAYDFLSSGDPELLRSFESEFEQRIDLAINDRTAATRLLTTALFVNDKPGFESLTWPVSLKVLETFENSESPEVKRLAASFRERLYFGKLDLGTLADRIELDDSRSRADVQKLFESLVINPDSRPKIYETAIAVIQRYQELGKTDDVQALTTWLRDICANAKDEQQRQEILAALDELEKE